MGNLILEELKAQSRSSTIIHGSRKKKLVPSWFVLISKNIKLARFISELSVSILEILIFASMVVHSTLFK
jgi:hypothetical protein